VRAVQGTYTGRLAGYYTRLQRRSGGYFISRDEIDRKSYRNLSQLLRNVPGINAFPMKSGGGTVRMREQQCRPLIWLDGVPMPAAEVDLDAFPVSSLHGIEAYPGHSNTPQDFLISGGLGCGTIALWSRGADTDPLIRRGKQPLDLEKLITLQKAFSSEQVDQRASLLDPDALTVMYPPELVADGLAGTVLVEYVVDATGGIERESISVVSSSHPLFSAAVILALKNVSYHPAIKAGNAVRQIVQQPFSFLPNSGRTSQGLK
jgi:TonB family protein